ncbi:tyrosine-type recombinase/integrase, partial [Arcobacteraceae bacterium]|nr:tyrosine-type recombinase/integrase [Arcobacteraceae bacterium]
MSNLTDRTIKTAKPKEKDYVLTDGAGLQINIRANKTKRWEFIYKSPTTNKRRKLPLGFYPTIPLKDIRLIRDKNINLISQGIDPIDKKRDDESKSKLNDNSNFILIADEWLSYEEKRTTPETHKRKKAILVNDSYPFFKNKSINDINHQDIIKVLEMRLNKTIHKSSIKAKQNNGIETANKLFNYLDTIFKFAITKGLCKYNPFNDIIKDLVIPKAKTVHNPKLTETTDIKKLVNDVYNYQGHYSTINALKFALHIPLRADNLVNIKWEYINFDESSLTIPRELMKVKNHNLPDFKVPLSDEVIKILKEQYELTNFQDFVFLSNAGKPINSNTPNGALKRMGYQDKQTLHGFRGIYRSLIDTHQKEHNLDYEVKRRFLDHHDENKVERAYNHRAEYFEQMKPLVKWWSDYIMNLKD